MTRNGRPVVKIIRAGQPPKRNISGEELVRRMDALQKSIIERDPGMADCDPALVIREMRDEDGDIRPG